MTAALQLLAQRFFKAALGVMIAIYLVLMPIHSSEAAKSSMTGDYVKDTISVSKSLQETIGISSDSEERLEAQNEAVELITDYISRYRNRSQYNGSVSFTTMQTALNSMAGHYKTFAKRPLPEDLKERLNKELAQAEKLALRES
tara:strand:- start:395 stop:826 length:432 start_codon:yes stop_codon:yes gene_type:complete